jgi:hypothetical protein
MCCLVIETMEEDLENAFVCGFSLAVEELRLLRGGF